MQPSESSCGCYACRCGYEHACKVEPLPVVFDDREPSILSTVARFESRFFYEPKGGR